MQTYSHDTGMEFGKEKETMQIIRSGRRRIPEISAERE